MNVSRRGLLETGSALLAGTTVLSAGAAGSPGRDGAAAAEVRRQSPPVPNWADWVPAPAAAPEGAQGSVLQYDMATSLALKAEETPDEPLDSMVLNPLSVDAYTALTWAVLENIGLDQLVVGPAAEDDADPADVPTDRGISVGSVQVYLGSFDEQAIRDVVEGQTYSATGATDVYEHQSGGTFVRFDAGAVAVGADAAAVETVFEAGRGQVDRRYDTAPDFEWLLRNGGQGDLTTVRMATGKTVDLSKADKLTADYSMFEGSKGYAQSATVENAEAKSASTAVVYASESAVKRTRLDANLGTKATDRTISQNGRKVVIEATYGGGDQVDEATATTEAVAPGMGIAAGVASLLGGAYLYGRRGDGNGDR